MEIHQLRYNRDNFSYVISHGQEAIAIDGGAVADIVALVKAKGLTLVAITNTHGHPDHTQGNATLCRLTGVPEVPHTGLVEKGGIQVGGKEVGVMATPGHTVDSVCFVMEDAMITGDTLFNGTIGNCFSGDLDGFLHSIQTLMTFPKTMRVYAGHDYVKESIGFARSIEPENPHLAEALERYDAGHVVSTLAEERLVNPYLRYDDPVMIALMAARGLPTATQKERWYSLMELY